MKKTILAQMLLCTFVTFTSLSSYAGATNSDNSATDAGRSTTAVNPDSDAQRLSANESRNYSDIEDGDDNDYSWVGLIGLLGLAGLMRKDRVDTTRVSKP